MSYRQYFPLLVAAFLTATGIFFLAVPFFNLPVFDTEPPREYFLMGLSAGLCLLGILYIVLFRRGELKRRGESLTEVRKKALESVSTESYLAKIANEDPDPEVRAKALERLKKLQQ
jgi:hypothetical protein